MTGKPNLNFYSSQALLNLPVEYQKILRAKFADGIFQMFIEEQIKEARLQVAELDPSDFAAEKAVEFLQVAKDARLILRFWTDLLTYSKDQAEALDEDNN